MKKFKKSIAFILALCIMATLAACAGNGTQQEVSDTLEGANIRVVIPSHPNWPYRDEWKVLEYIKEATGANIEVTAYPSADYTTKMSLMMADPENIPDLICMPDMGYVTPYVSQGAFIAVEDVSDKMPNYTAFWSSLPEDETDRMLSMRRSADGKTYFPQVYGRQNTINLRAWLYRKDIFEKHNLKTPETTDEMYEVAKQLKEHYPDSFPICLRGFFGNGVGVIGAEWKPNFTYGVYYDFANDEWCYGGAEDTMLDVVTYFKKLSDEKLIPPNFVNISGGEWSELVHTNRTFMFPQYQVQMDVLNAESRINNPEFTMAAMVPPRANTATGQNLLGKWNVDPCGYVICNSRDERRISNAVALLDWFYSDEACELLSWGKEGETYELVNGEKKYILEDGEDVRCVYGFQTNSFICRIEPEAVMESFSDEQRNSTEFLLEHTEKEYNPARWVGLNEEEAAVRDTTGVEIDMYMEEMLSKFLLGTEPLSKWDEYVTNIKEMGVDKLLAAYESAYNRVK